MSTEIVGWALEGLEKEIATTRERLSALNAQAARLRSRVRGSSPPVANDSGMSGRPRRRARMSAAGRKRISDMMKKRWAEAKRKKQNRLS